QTQPSSSYPALTLARRAGMVSRLARKLAGAAVRGRWNAHPHPDDRHNVRRLLYASASERAHCPLCGYVGGFLHHAGRPRQICPACGSRARHRVFSLAFDRWQEKHGAQGFERCLHLAPEPCLDPRIERACRVRVTGDLNPQRGDLAFDLCALPVRDESFDFVFASHVLEHIVDDRAALRECLRVLRPGGLAVLPVPITAAVTEDFGFVDASRNEHARECGPDYFDRYAEAGFEVEVWTGEQVGDVERYALLTWVDGEPTEHQIPFCRKPL
ncbi:MAG: class I SAM-dependent methyltransferase, partial [Acidobacteriota bacterium]